MALKVIMLRHSIEKKKAELEQLRARDAEFITREAELEAAINEAETEEQEQAVTEMVEKFDAEKQAHEASKTALAGEIEVPVEYVAVEDVYGEVGPQDYLRERFDLTADHIVRKVKKVLSRKAK